VRVWLALVAGAALCSPASATGLQHVVETASSGGVQAQFSYDFTAPATFSNEHLTIKREGTVLVDREIRPFRFGAAWPANYWNHRRSVFARDLDGDSEPEVYLTLYWGGAHCCEYTQVYRYGASGSYSLRTHVWGNPGVRLGELGADASPEFVSGDDRFAYQFTDYADSSWPIQIWSYRAGVFSKVTRRFPQTIANDARRQWRFLSGRRADGQRVRGALAAWAGDECLRSRCGYAFGKVDALRRAGRLRVSYACPCDATAAAYVAHLHRFLRRTGYLR